MITDEKKKRIESLSEDEMAYEINLGRRSRFQRESFAYLQTCYQQRNKKNKELVIPTTKESPILPFIQERLESTKKEIKDDLFLWLSGKKHPNLEFSGTLVDVYWGPSLDGHVKKIIDTAFATNREIATEHGLNPSKTVNDGTIAAEQTIKEILNLMADYDRRMRGKGYPQNVPLRDVTEFWMKHSESVHTRAENEYNLLSISKKGQSTEVPNPTTTPTTDITNSENNWQNKTLYYIAVGVIIAVLATFIIYLIKKHFGVPL